MATAKRKQQQPKTPMPAEKAEPMKDEEATDLHWFLAEHFIRQIFGPHYESVVLRRRREKLIEDQSKESTALTELTLPSR